MKLPATILSVALVSLPVIGCSVASEEPGADTDSSESIAEGLSAQCRDEFDGVRRATAKYHDVNVAIADGYQLGSGCEVSPPQVPASQAGGMGFHYYRLDLMFAPPDPNHPAMLLYEPTKDGGKRLIGVEYYTSVFCNGAPYFGTGVPNDPSMPPPMASGNCFPTPDNPPKIFGSAYEGPMPGHAPGMPWHYDKHAWIWKKNPNGMFSQWNPRVDCTP